VEGTAMETRIFGRTGLELSVLGFGCGAVGGLMVRGDPNYFDTAVQYGDGESEKNLGRILQQLKPPSAVVGTKAVMSAFGGKADIAFLGPNVRLWPKADIGSALACEGIGRRI